MLNEQESAIKTKFKENIANALANNETQVLSIVNSTPQQSIMTMADRSNDSEIYAFAEALTHSDRRTKLYD